MNQNTRKTRTQNDTKNRNILDSDVLHMYRYARSKILVKYGLLTLEITFGQFYSN